MKRSAEISECGRYRWWLQRRWEDGGKIVCFVMLNPSTADADNDDPTIRRCIGFAMDWGYSALNVRNLFPWRATNPNDLKSAAKRGEDIRGGSRGDSELMAAKSADMIIAAWGKYPCESQARRFFDMMGQVPIFCLGLTKNGTNFPAHPLYLPKDRRPIILQG